MGLVAKRIQMSVDIGKVTKSVVGGVRGRKWEQTLEAAVTES